MRALVADQRVQPIVNLCTNGSFESGVEGWSQNGGAEAPVADAARAHTGSRSLRTERGAGSSQFTARYYMIPSSAHLMRPHTVSLWLWASSTSNGTTGIRLGGHVSPGPFNVYVEPQDQWMNITTAFVPSGDFILYIYADPGPVWVDDVMITYGDTVYEFADGDSPGWRWLPDGTSIGYPHLT